MIDSVTASRFDKLKTKVRSFGSRNPLTIATIAFVLGFGLRGCFG